MNFPEIKDNVQELSSQFASERIERQKRRDLHREDFNNLVSAGYETGVLAEQGGLWKSIPASVRQICDLLRILAHGDSSLALVSSMHPSVLAFWLATPHVEEAHNKAWCHGDISSLYLEFGHDDFRIYCNTRRTPIQ